MIQDSETFPIGALMGVLWKDDEGWHGCLRGDVEGDTNFVGPFDNKESARQALIREAQ